MLLIILLFPVYLVCIPCISLCKLFSLISPCCFVNLSSRYISPGASWFAYLLYFECVQWNCFCWGRLLTHGKTETEVSQPCCDHIIKARRCLSVQIHKVKCFFRADGGGDQLGYVFVKKLIKYKRLINRCQHAGWKAEGGWMQGFWCQIPECLEIYLR